MDGRSIVAQALAGYRDRFPGPNLGMVLASIAAGNTAGHLWEIPRRAAEPVLLLWDQGNNVLYLAGECREASSFGRLAEVISGEVLTRMVAAGDHRFKVRALAAPMERGLPQLFPGISLHASPSLFYTHDWGWDPESAPKPGWHDFSLQPIRPETLADGAYKGSDAVRQEIKGMWPSEEQFYEHGFGVLATQDDEIVCWCTAEYVGPTHCGIGIETTPGFQRRGIATATAVAFVRDARARGITPCWECGASNVASRRVAEKTGFVYAETCAYWIGSIHSA